MSHNIVKKDFDKHNIKNIKIKKYIITKIQILCFLLDFEHYDRISHLKHVYQQQFYLNYTYL